MINYIKIGVVTTILASCFVAGYWLASTIKSVELAECKQSNAEAYAQAVTEASQESKEIASNIASSAQRLANTQSRIEMLAKQMSKDYAKGNIPLPADCRIDDVRMSKLRAAASQANSSRP